MKKSKKRSLVVLLVFVIAIVFLAIIISTSSLIITGKSITGPIESFQDFYNQITGLSLQGAQQEGLIPLNVSDPSGVDYLDEPISSGIPFPIGVLNSTNNVRILDAGMNEVPTQFEVLTTWKDGSIKWLLVDFQASVNAGQTSGYYLEYGPDVSNSATHSNPVGVSEDANYVTVSTANFQFTINKNSFNLFDTVTLGGTELVSPSSSNGAIVNDSSDTEFFSSLNNPTVTVEETGPLRAVIKVEGKHRDASSNEFVDYIARIHAYAGKSYASVSYTFINKEVVSTSCDSDFIDPNDIVLKTRVNLGANPQYTFGTDSSWYSNILSTGSSAYNYQSGQSSYNIYENSNPVSSGSRPTGFSDLQDASNGLMISVRDFWQLYPKIIEVSDGYITVNFWPSQSSAIFDQYGWRLWRGRAKTHDLLYYFHNAETQSSLFDYAERFQNPLIATAPPEWYTESKALGNLLSYNPENFSSYEYMVSLRLLNIINGKEYNNVYGIINYGDSTADDTGISFDNVEYDVPYALYIQYVRTGDRRFFEEGWASVKHYQDIDVMHDMPRGQCGGVFGGTGANWAGPAYHRNEVEAGHVWGEGVALNYYLTGDKWSLETLNIQGDFFSYAMTREVLDRWRCNPERYSAWPLAIIIADYKATRDPAYLEHAKYYIDMVLDWQDQDGLWYVWCGTSTGGKNSWMLGLMLDSLVKYYQETGDERVKVAVIQGVDYLLTDEFYRPHETPGYGGADAFWQRPDNCPPSGPSCCYVDLNLLIIHALGEAYNWTGDPKYIRKGERLFNSGVKRSSFTDVEFTSGKQVAQHLRNSARFAYWLNEFYKEYPKETHPTITLMSHLDNAADVAIPTYGRGGAVFGWIDEALYNDGLFGPGKSNSGFRTNEDKHGYGSGDPEYMFFPTRDNINQAQGTIEFWISPLIPDIGNNYYQILASWGDSATNRFYIETHYGGVRFYTRVNSVDSQTLAQPISWNVGEWHHVAASWGLTGLHLYIDGSEVASQPGFTNGLGFLTNFYTYPAGGNFTIDELKVHNVQLTAIDLAPIVSDPQQPAVISDLVATRGSVEGTVDLTWTSVGDDGNSGTASGYVIKYYTEPITQYTWPEALDVPNEPTPQSSGTQQSYTVTGLIPYKQYYFAIKAYDDAYFQSNISNIASARAGIDAGKPAGNIVLIPESSVAVADGITIVTINSDIIRDVNNNIVPDNTLITIETNISHKYLGSSSEFRPGTITSSDAGSEPGIQVPTTTGVITFGLRHDEAEYVNVIARGVHDAALGSTQVRFMPQGKNLSNMDVAIFIPTVELDADYYGSVCGMLVSEKINISNHLLSNLNSPGVSSVQAFDHTQQASLVTWMNARLSDGNNDILIIVDGAPAMVYSGQDDGSLAENWMENGNTIVWTSVCWPFFSYVDTSGIDYTDGAGVGARNEILDSYLNPSVTEGFQLRTSEGEKYLPILLSYGREVDYDHPQALLAYPSMSSPWQVDTIFADDIWGDQESDAIVLNHTSGGYFAQLYSNVRIGTKLPYNRGEIIEEFIENWMVGYTGPIQQQECSITNAYWSVS